MTMGWRKRLKPAAIIPGVVIKSAVSITEFRIDHSNRKNGLSVFYEVFDKNTAYSGGITLAKDVRMSGNNLIIPLTVFRTDQTIYPATGKNIFTDSGVNCYHWKCESLNQSTNAMDTRAKLPDGTTVVGGQYQVDTANHKKLKLTKTSADAEIDAANLTQILSDSQRLVVKYYIEDVDITFY